MYLKNTSKRAIVINTVIGKVGIKPGEIIDIKYKILPPVSSALVQVQEEEYISFCEKREGTIETVIKMEKPDVPEYKPVVPEENLDDLEKIEEPEEVEIQDPGIMGFVNNLINPETKEKEEDKEKEKALKVVETETKDQITKLEQQIEDLKVVWSTATSPRRKEKIGKEIKELQKQLKKLKK